MSGSSSAVTLRSSSAPLASLRAHAALSAAAALVVPAVMTLAFFLTLATPLLAAPDVGTESPPGPPLSLRTERVLDAPTLDQLGVPHPSRVVFDASHCLYVLDAGARRIVKLDPKGNLLWDLGGYGDDDQSFSLPSDLAIDRRQSLLVLDRGKNALVAFDPAGHFLGVRSFGASVASDAGDPGARLLVDPFGDLWLLGTRSRDLIPLDDRLERSRSSRFLAPEDEAGAPAAAVFLPSSGGWIFDAAARKLRRFGNNGQITPALPDSLAPQGAAALAIDGAGYLYVADTAAQRLLVLDPGGTLRFERALGGAGVPWHPGDIAVSRSDRVAVVDPGKGEIQILTVERGRAP